MAWSNVSLIWKFSHSLIFLNANSDSLPLSLSQTHTHTRPTCRCVQLKSYLCAPPAICVYCNGTSYSLSASIVRVRVDARMQACNGTHADRKSVV